MGKLNLSKSILLHGSRYSIVRECDVHKMKGVNWVHLDQD